MRAKLQQEIRDVHGGAATAAVAGAAVYLLLPSRQLPKKQNLKNS